MVPTHTQRTPETAQAMSGGITDGDHSSEGSATQVFVALLILRKYNPAHSITLLEIPLSHLLIRRD